MRFRDEEHLEEYPSGGNGGLILIRIIGIMLAVVFLPAFLVGYSVYYVFLRKLKWRPSVTLLPIAMTMVLMLAFSKKGLANLGLLFKEGLSGPVLFSYGYLSLMLGLVIGYFYMLSKSMELRRYPELKHIKGWAYGFEYAPTPLERMRKKKNIESLKNGEEFDYERAPIGVLDAPVKLGDLEDSVDVKNSNAASIVYRYYTEAMEHTLITGKTGSGKALHKDTKVPTIDGMKTVGTVNIGDILYDENGQETTVIDKFQPMTPDHYKIEFDNGEIVKACGDHLWEVVTKDKDTPYVTNTRDMYNNIQHNSEQYMIKGAKNIDIEDKRKAHVILKITPIKDSKEDYFCFTVDSPSSLFLITDSYIPTHNTVTMLSLIYNDILAGHSVAVIDFKKSPDFIYYLSKWAKENDREFYHFVSGKPGTYKNPFKDDQATYDPLATGGATSKADMILNLRTWDASSEVFKKRTQDVLQSLFFLLERTPRSAVPGIDWDSGGLAQFVSALDLDNFRAMIEYMAKEEAAGKLSPGDSRRYRTLLELHKELSTPRQSDLKAQIVELLSIARTLIVSNYGDWLAKGASEYHIDLMEIATSENAPIVLFSFNQQEEPEFAEYIGSIVMSDLSRVSALKNAQGNRNKFGVYIDEFQTLDPATVKDNLEKARSSRMYITLSLQSIDQIVSSAQTQGEAMANAIIDTTANFIFHDGSGYDTAEKMSKIIGKSNRYVYKTTSKMSNGLFDLNILSNRRAMVSKDIMEDWLIPPSSFQSLESPTAANGYKATAYVINKAPDDDRFQRSGGALARKVHVVVDEAIAGGVPESFQSAIYIPQEENKEFSEILAETEKEYSMNKKEGGWEIEDVVELPKLDDLKSNNPYDDIL